MIRVVVSIAALLTMLRGGWLKADDLGKIAARLPSQTRVALYASDADDLDGKWKTTPFGKVGELPAMAGFRQELEAQEATLGASLRREYGVDLELLRGVAQQQLVVAGIETEKELSFSFLIELRDEQQAQSAALVEDAIKRLTARGAVRSALALPVAATLCVRPDGEEVVFADLKSTPPWLMISGSQESARLLLKQWTEGGGESLASNPALQDVLGRTKLEKPTDYYWFADVIRMAVAAEKKNPPKNRSTATPFPLRHGFPGLKGVGGQGRIEDGAIDNRVAISSPPPREKALRAFVFPPGDVAVPDFVPAGVSSCTVIRWDLMSLLNHIGDVFDDIADAPGAYEDWIRSLQEEIGVNLRGVILPALSPKIVSFGIYTPNQREAERSVIAIEILNPRVNERSVALGLYRMFINDPDATPVNVGVGPGQERYKLWKLKLVVGKKDASGAAAPPAFSEGGMMVARGQLWIATHASLIEDVLLGKLPGRLVEDPAYLAVQKRHAGLLKPPYQATLYARTDRDFQHTYEMLRQHGIEGLKLADNLYGNLLLNVLNNVGSKNDVDFSKLPPFAAVAESLGVSAAWAMPSENNGSEYRIVTEPR